MIVHGRVEEGCAQGEERGLAGTGEPGRKAGGWPGRSVAPQSAGVNAPSVLVRSRRWTRDLCVGMPCRKKPPPPAQISGSAQGLPWKGGRLTPGPHRDVRTGQLRVAGRAVFSPLSALVHTGVHALCLFRSFPKMKGTR